MINILYDLFLSLQSLWSSLSVFPSLLVWSWGPWSMCSWPGCPDAEQARPASPAAHLATHTPPLETAQASTGTAATTDGATTVWSAPLSPSTVRHPPRIISTHWGTNPASGPRPSTLSSSAAKSPGRQRRVARRRFLVHPLWQPRLDRLTQQPNQLPPHPDLSRFGGTMAWGVSKQHRPHLQLMRASLGLIRKHAPERGESTRLSETHPRVVNGFTTDKGLNWFVWPHGPGWKELWRQHQPVLYFFGFLIDFDINIAWKTNVILPFGTFSNVAVTI